MGWRGPPPTPAATLEARGSNRATRRGPEPEPERRRPRLPSWLPKPARVIFRELVRQLEAMGLLGLIDGRLVVRYAQLTVRWQTNEEFLNKNGQTYVVRGRGKKRPDGTREDGPILGVKTYPQVRIARNLAGELLRMEDRMGMSPAARARLAGYITGAAAGGEGTAGGARSHHFAAG